MSTGKTLLSSTYNNQIKVTDQKKKKKNIQEMSNDLSLSNISYNEYN